jgi:hypothetical protein
LAFGLIQSKSLESRQSHFTPILREADDFDQVKAKKSALQILRRVSKDLHDSDPLNILSFCLAEPHYPLIFVLQHGSTFPLTHP